MKTGYTHVEVLLDRSGSMAVVQSDTIGGFNRFIEDQKKIKGDCTVSLTQFDDRYEPNYLVRPIAEVTPLDIMSYQPRGWTALLDGLARTIDTLGQRLAALPESERPEKIIFVTITDGHENKSVEFNRAQVKERVERQRDQYKWEFVFLAADLAGIKDAASVGFNAQQTFQYNNTSRGVDATYQVFSAGIASARAGGKGLTHAMNVNRASLKDTK